jgi:hypothetical protein
VSGHQTAYIILKFSRAADRKTGQAALSRKKRTWHLLQSKWRQT